MNMNRAGAQSVFFMLFCMGGCVQASFFKDVLAKVVDIELERSFQAEHHRRVIAIKQVLFGIVCEMPQFMRLFPSHSEQAVLHEIQHSWRVLHADWLDFVDDHIYDYGLISLPILDDAYDALSSILCSMGHAHRVPYCAYYILSDIDHALGSAIDYIQPNYAGHVWPDALTFLISQIYEIDYVLRPLC